MGKAAMAAAGAVVAGVAAFAGLTGWMPVAWAEGAALILTGSTLLGASFMVEGAKAPGREAEPVLQPVTAQRAQEA
jgi:hypothetical protein